MHNKVICSTPTSLRIVFFKKTFLYFFFTVVTQWHSNKLLALVFLTRHPHPSPLPHICLRSSRSLQMPNSTQLRLEVCNRRFPRSMRSQGERPGCRALPTCSPNCTSAQYLRFSRSLQLPNSTPLRLVGLRGLQPPP